MVQSTSTVPAGCTWNSNEVTTPKLPPPPRRPQNKSSFRKALAISSWPSAVTTSADTRLSRATMFAHQPTEPAAQGQARDAGCRNEATGGGEPESLKVMVQLAPRGATFDARCARHRIDPHGFHE